GLALSFIILLYVSDSLRYDRFHKNNDRIYRLISDSEKWGLVTSSHANTLGDRILEESSGIEKLLIISKFINPLKLEKDNDLFPESEMYLVDSNFFELMSFDLEYGNPGSALKNPYSIVISKAISEKYFGKEDPIGKSIILWDKDNSYELRVTGVMEEIPRLSTFRPQILLAAELARKMGFKKDDENEYDTRQCYTYVLLHKNQDIKKIEDELSALSLKYNPVFEFKIKLQNIKDIYLRSSGYQDGSIKKGNPKDVKVFSIIGILIIFISCINYIIISIAQSASRNKEIALKKIFGASRQKIIRQILNESVLISLIALPTALVLVEIFIPSINNLFKVELILNYFKDSWYLLLMIIITIAIGLLSGSYIALYLSKLKPVGILKLKFGIKGSRNYLGKSLIIIQIMIFTGLIFSCSVIIKQINFAKTIDHGFNQNNLLSLDCSYMNSNNEITKPLSKLYPQFIESIRQNPDIINASACFRGPSTSSFRKLAYTNPENPDKNIVMEALDIKYDFIKTVGFKLIDGRSFSRDFASDSVNSVIINEEGVKALGLINPVGKIIKRGMREYKIIGVIKNFFMHSVQDLIPPIILSITNNDFLMEVVIRYKPEKIKKVLSFVEDEYGKIDSEAPFNVQYYDQKITNLYGSERLFARNIIIFTLIAIFIAAMGLFGFSLYMVQLKTKEIGIRKCLGANNFRIITFINNEFIVLTVIANIIIQPIVWIIMNNWLRNYAYRTSIDITVIITSLLISTLIILLTINININIAARKKPADTLRSE
ncbi:ABC transporter permease, partial [Bacteroidota bacterium]